MKRVTDDHLSDSRHPRGAQTPMHDSQHLETPERGVAAARIAEAAHLRIISDPAIGYVRMTGDSTTALSAFLALLDIDPEPAVSSEASGRGKPHRPLARLTKTEAQQAIDAGVPISIERNRR